MNIHRHSVQMSHQSYQLIVIGSTRLPTLPPGAAQTPSGDGPSIRRQNLAFAECCQLLGLPHRLRPAEPLFRRADQRRTGTMQAWPGGWDDASGREL